MPNYLARIAIAGARTSAPARPAAVAPPVLSDAAPGPVLDGAPVPLEVDGAVMPVEPDSPLRAASPAVGLEMPGTLPAPGEDTDVPRGRLAPQTAVPVPPNGPPAAAAPVASPLGAVERGRDARPRSVRETSPRLAFPPTLTPPAGLDPTRPPAMPARDGAGLAPRASAVRGQDLDRVGRGPGPDRPAFGSAAAGLEPVRSDASLVPEPAARRAEPGVAEEPRPVPSPVAPPPVGTGERGPRVRVSIGRLDVQVHAGRPSEPGRTHPPAPPPPARPARAAPPFAANALEQRGLERFGLAP